MGRYDWLYELKPVPIKEKLLDELARHLAEELAAWPPVVHAFRDASEARRYHDLAKGRFRPDGRFFAYACHLVRLELEGEFDQIAYESRSERWREVVPDSAGYDALRFTVEWLLHALLEVKEVLETRLTRRDLAAVTRRIESRLTAPTASAGDL